MSDVERINASERARRRWKPQRVLSIKASLLLFVGIPAAFIGCFYVISTWPHFLLAMLPLAAVLGIVFGLALAVVDAVRGVDPPRSRRIEDMPDDAIPDGVARFPDRSEP